MVIFNINQHYFKVTICIRNRMPGIKKDGAPKKYNKVNQQKKFQLLSLFYKHNIPLRQAAAQAGINYLTAKTILFFHKKDHKSYQFDLDRIPPIPLTDARITASYAPLRKRNTYEDYFPVPKSRVEVFSLTGGHPNSETLGQEQPNNHYRESNFPDHPQQFLKIQEDPYNFFPQPKIPNREAQMRFEPRRPILGRQEHYGLRQQAVENQSMVKLQVMTMRSSPKFTPCPSMFTIKTQVDQ